jgi:hypothetical protein
MEQDNFIKSKKCVLFQKSGLILPILFIFVYIHFKKLCVLCENSVNSVVEILFPSPCPRHKIYVKRVIGGVPVCAKMQM